MNVGIISLSGLGDLIQCMSFMPSIVKSMHGITEWTFFIKVIHEYRMKIIEDFISNIFHDSININIYYYEPQDEKNIVVKANDLCDWVFAPMGDNPMLCPAHLYPSSLNDVKIVCGTNKNVRKLKDKDKFSNCQVFCHLYSGSRGEDRNLPFEVRNNIGNLIINNFGKYNAAFFSWDDPDVDKYDFNVIKNPDMMEIIQSENNQLYIGVDSWIHSLICGTNSWICWTENDWKMNTQRVSNKLYVNPGLRLISSSKNTKQILSAVSLFKRNI